MTTKKALSVTIDTEVNDTLDIVVELLLLNRSAVVNEAVAKTLKDYFKKYPEIKSIVDERLEEKKNAEQNN